MEVQKILESKENLIKFLKEKGLEEEKDYFDDEYKEGTYFKIDKRKLLVVYEIFDEEKLKEIKDHFLIDRGLSYCVIIYNHKIIFFRNFGETKHFIYSERTKNNRSKIDKLENIGVSVDSLFQSKDISAQFYEAFKQKRNLLVQHIKNDIEPTEKYLIAQKIFDRFFFIYFLCHKGIIKFENGGKISGENLFSRILLKTGNFLENLKKLFHLFNSVDKNILEIGEYKIVIPYLNGGLFRPDVLEQDLDISLSNKQWEEIFEFLNSYHWIIEDVKATEEHEERILTPEILGHVYERSVVEWEQKGFEKEAEESIRKISERKKKGVYYTPESITDYISKNTIISYLLDRLGNKYSSFEELIESKNKKDMKEALKVLDEIKVLDPACGSGAFLIKASEILFGLKRRLYYELGEKKNFYDLKLDIITENIYGVDILQGAIEIAKLRLWLWLISDFEESKNEIKALPNIEYNLKVGNSLIGWLDENLKQMPINTPLTEKVDGIFTGLIAFSENGDAEELKKARELLKGYKLDDYIEAYYILYKIYRRAHGLKAENLRSILETIRESIYSVVTPAFLDYVNHKIKPKYDPKKPPITKEEFDKLQVFHWRIDFGHIIRQGGFDVVIGNPPYGQNKLRNLESKYLERVLYSIGKKNEGGTKNLAPIFVEKSFNLVKKNGFLSFIINNSITRVDEFNKFRKWLLTNTNLIEIVDEGNPFRDVTLEMVTLFLKNSEQKNEKIKIFSRRFNEEHYVPTKIFMKYNRFILYYDSFFEKIIKESAIGVIYGSRGMSLQYKKTKDNIYNIPVCMSGKSVKKYYIDNKFLYWTSIKYLTNSLLNELNLEYLITIRGGSNKYRVAMKPKGYINADGTSKINSNNKYLDKKYLMAILNSKLIDFFVFKYLLNYSTLTITINKSVFSMTPIPKISPAQQKPFIKLVDEILSITKSKDYLQNKEKQAKVKELQDKIDKMVYELYELTEEEIKIVEGNVNEG